MGSSKSKEPSPPSVADTSRQAIEAQIDSLPKMLAAQKEYGPQFTEQFLREAQQYAPQILDLQRQFEKEYSPETVSARKVLDEYFAQPGELSPFEERQARDAFRGAQSARGMAQSGMGAEEEMRGLTALRQQLKMQRIGLAMQMAQGGSTQLQTIQGQAAISPIGQLGIQNVSPAQIFGLAQENFANQLEFGGGSGFDWGGAAGGAIGGAATGATIGALGGPMGMAIGGATGGLLGAAGGGLS